MGLPARPASVGDRPARCGMLPGRPAGPLEAEAVRLALEDAGLQKEDVDGLLTEPQFGEPLMLHGHVLGRMLGLKTNYLSTKSIGGGTALSLVAGAATAVDNALCEVAVWVFAGHPWIWLPLLVARAPK